MIWSKLLSSGAVGKMKSQTILSAAKPQISANIPPIAINIIGLSYYRCEVLFFLNDPCLLNWSSTQSLHYNDPSFVTIN